MFENLKRELEMDEKAHEKYYLNEDMARRYSTAHRYDQFQNGEISEDDYQECACSRYNAEQEKKLRKNLQKLEEVGTAARLKEITLVCEFNRQHNVSCVGHVYTDDFWEEIKGAAAGYGYDKESSAIAEAMDKSDSILRELYEYKEHRLTDGLSDSSRLAVSGHDNRDIIGYGAGYDVLPYFEGAVGSECYWRIFEKMGFKVRAEYGGKSSTFYHIYRD